MMAASRPLSDWLLDESPDLIAIATVDGALVYANRAARAVLGVEDEAPLAGCLLSQLQPVWAWEVVQGEGIPLALAEGSWSGETAALRPGGVEFPAAQRLLVTGTGSELRIASILHDLTPLKEGSRERLELVNRYETAIRLSGHVLLDWEPYTGDLACSGDIQGVLGRDSCDFAEGFRTLRSFIHPEDLALFDQEIQRTITSRNSLVVSFRLQHRDGAYRYVRAAGGYYLDRAGRFGRITALLMNVDYVRHAREEVQRLEAQLALGVEDQVRQAREDAERARQAKNEFLSRMSHELRTPLNAILGFSQLLELEEPTPRQKESLDHIVRAGQHLLSLINEVLDLSRLESGRLPITLTSVPVDVAVREAVDLMRPTAEQQQISLIIAPEGLPSGERVLADQQRLRQVLHNLISNAIKFNRASGSVVVEGRRTGERRLRISITDTGPGIAAERLEQLFKPLEAATPAGAESRGGAGLGLAISRGIMRAMQGELGVESKLGDGSSFWIELPLAPTEPLEPTLSDDLIASLGGPLEQHTILYVEDEDLNLQLVRRVLADYPEYRLITTMQGSLALELAHEHHPDLILLDLNLPDLSGETVLTRLKEADDLRRIPVIMVTADVLGHRLERLIEAGAAGYLTKPFKITEFIRVIRDTLAG